MTERTPEEMREGLQRCLDTFALVVTATIHTITQSGLCPLKADRDTAIVMMTVAASNAPAELEAHEAIFSVLNVFPEHWESAIIEVVELLTTMQNEQ